MFMREDGLPMDSQDKQLTQTPKAAKPDEMVATLRDENEEYLICQESLTVDVHEGGRFTHGLTEQEVNQSPEEGKHIIL